MEDLAETLWREFAIETEEHFEILERLLVASETQTAEKEDISQLFRSFHSVKGLSRSMDMRGMEKLGHHSENLLGLVREGKAPLDSDVIGLLLLALDALKNLREVAVAERSDSPAPAQLIENLEKEYAAREKGGPVVKPQEIVAALPAAVAAPPAAEEVQVADTSLHEDAEMLCFFTEMLEERLPIIAKIATNAVDDPAIRADVVDALDGLIHASDVMGFDNLNDGFSRLHGFVAGNASLSPEAKRQAVIILGEMRTALDALGQAGGVKVDAHALGERLAAGIRGEFEGLYNETIKTLALFETGSDVVGQADSDQALADEMASLARSLYTFFLFLEFDRVGRIMLMVEDIFSRVANREIFLYPEIIQLTKEALEHIHVACLSPGSVADMKKDDASSLLERFRQCLLAGSGAVSEGVDPVNAVRKVLQTYDIKQELVDILSHDNIKELLETTSKGGNFVYEILAHLESSEELTMGFVKWLQTVAKPITNRALFIDGASWFEFLIISENKEEVIQHGVKALDPSGKLIIARQCPLKKEEKAQPGSQSDKQKTSSANSSAQGQSAKSGGKASSILRVSGETVDGFISQIGEMVVVSNMLNLAVTSEESNSALQSLRLLLQDGALKDQAVALLEKVEKSFQRFAEADQRLHSVLGHLQNSALELRVVPIDTVFTRFPRLVRDLAQAHGKQIRLDLEGAEVRIDKGMVEVLLDPLMHMVRNAVDHAIESPEERQAAGKQPLAKVVLRAIQRGNHVMVEIQDDGRGLDAERIRNKAVEKGLITAQEGSKMPKDQIYRLIFAPGFSTAEKITETSGRGVGMDVVLTNITRLGGRIDVKTELGQGSTFILQLPLSAAIQTAVMVEAGGHTLAIPERYLSEIHESSGADFQYVRGQRAILLRNSFLPIFNLGGLLWKDSQPEEDGRRRPIVVLSNGRNRIGIEVERLYRRQELFVKEIHPKIAAIPGVGGASILGDGRVVLIVDGDDLFKLAERAGGQIASSLLH